MKCEQCGGPMDLRSLELSEEFGEQVPCLRCFYEHHTGHRYPTTDQLPDGWELEPFILPTQVRRTRPRGHRPSDDRGMDPGLFGRQQGYGRG